MKTKAIFAACALLFCGGLFCLHLTAQSEKTSDVPVAAKPIALLESKMLELSEQELLERKVDSHRKFVESVTTHYEVGSPRGSAILLGEAQAGLAAAEIELYRYTGDRDKLLAAHQARVEALTQKLEAAKNAYDADRISPEILLVSEIQLLDALLELKQEKKSDADMSAH
jgi:outer membrane protein TolC